MACATSPNESRHPPAPSAQPPGPSAPTIASQAPAVEPVVAAANPGSGCDPTAPKACGDGLTCFAEANGQGVCAPVHSVGELLAHPSRFRGALVGLPGAVVTALQTCTEKACGAANPCCNRCSARAHVVESQQYLELIRPDGTAYAASGNNCRLDSELGIIPGPHTIVGTLQLGALGPALRVRSIAAEAKP